MGLIPSSQRWFNTCKSINVIHHITHYYLNRCRKSIWQNSTYIHDKNSYQGGYRRNISQYNKNHLWQTHSQYNTQWRNAESLLLKSETRQGCLLTLTISTQHSIGSPSHSNQTNKRKEIKGIQIWGEEIKLSLYVDDKILYIENSWG